jgi:hypothetical protein
MSTRALIKLAGGAEAVSLASAETDHPVGVDAVYKWFHNGIPDDHWPLIISRAGVSVDDIYRANQDVKGQKKRKSLRKADSPQRCTAA